MSTTKTHGWRTYRFGERVVEIRKLYPKSGVTFDQTVAEGLGRGYRFLTGEEVTRLLDDTVRTPGYLAVPADSLTASVFMVMPDGAVRITIRPRNWLDTEQARYSVLFAED